MKQKRKTIACFLLGIFMLQSIGTVAYAAEFNEERTVPSGIIYADIPTAIENYAKEHKETTAGVHENIFEPLSMEHTSIDATYQDRAWVKQQREKLVYYDTNGEKIPGKGMYYILLYPAGSTAGTLGDLLTFSQAITPNEDIPCPLFEKQETMELLYTATSFYGSSNIANNYHGLFASYYGVETLGHGGNTFGCSTMLQFNPDTGIGMVVMTNQAHEQVYNYDMYELIFAKFSDSELAKIERDIPQMELWYLCRYDTDFGGLCYYVQPDFDWKYNRGYWIAY